MNNVRGTTFGGDNIHYYTGTADTVRVPGSSSLSYAVSSTMQPRPSSTVIAVYSYMCFQHSCAFLSIIDVNSVVNSYLFSVLFLVN